MFLISHLALSEVAYHDVVEEEEIPQVIDLDEITHFIEVPVVVVNFLFVIHQLEKVQVSGNVLAKKERNRQAV